MIFTTSDLLNKLKDYANAKTKINRMVHNHELFVLAKGIYTDDKYLHPFCAACITSKSYISFQTALIYYGLIRPGHKVITCATCNKRKSREITNYFGKFYYQDVAKQVYEYGIETKYINNQPFYIATAEKAICDMLYKLPAVKNLKQLESLLFNDLKVNKEMFVRLDINTIKELADRYHCTNVNLLNKLIKSKKFEEFRKEVIMDLVEMKKRGALAKIVKDNKTFTENYFHEENAEMIKKVMKYLAKR